MAWTKRIQASSQKLACRTLWQSQNVAKFLVRVCGHRCAQARLSVASADTVFSQPFNGTSDGQESQSGNFNYTAYDDFILSSAASITGVDWVGQYLLSESQTNDTIHSFTLTFYADLNGSPGSAIGSPQSFAGDAHESSLGSFGTNNLPSYSYYEVLNTSFAAAANTRYWLSIVPNINYSPAWYWAASNVTNGVSYEATFDPFDLEKIQGTTPDPAFSLNTSQSATPEPSGLILMGLGLLGTSTVAVARRRAQNSLKSRL